MPVKSPSKKRKREESIEKMCSFVRAVSGVGPSLYLGSLALQKLRDENDSIGSSTGNPSFIDPMLNMSQKHAKIVEGSNSIYL